MKIDLSKHKGEVFYKYIYPLFAQDFLFNSEFYEDFANLISRDFKLNPTQWEYILSEWELKESILTD